MHPSHLAALIICLISHSLALSVHLPSRSLLTERQLDSGCGILAVDCGGGYCCARGESCGRGGTLGVYCYDSQHTTENGFVKRPPGRYASSTVTVVQGQPTGSAAGKSSSNDTSSISPYQASTSGTVSSTSNVRSSAWTGRSRGVYLSCVVVLLHSGFYFLSVR